MRVNAARGTTRSRHTSAFPRRLATLLLVMLAAPGLARATTPFVTETVDGSVHDVGMYASLALDVRGHPHISYFDRTVGDLLHARKAGGVWIVETVDGSPNTVGWYGSLALDAGDEPHISYIDVTVWDLLYARKSGGSWTIETVDGSPNFVGGSSLALAADGTPHIGYLDYSLETETFDLLYARRSGGIWTLERTGVSSNVVDQSSLRLDGQNHPHIACRDTNYDLLYVSRSDGVWTVETVNGSANVVGPYASLALDTQDGPHIAYYDATANDLLYAYKASGDWTIERVDGSANSAGVTPSLALDSQGGPHIAYYDATANDLLFASKSGGIWIVETADGSPNDVGRFTSLALDAWDIPHICYRDQTDYDLLYAHVPRLIATPMRETLSNRSDPVDRWNLRVFPNPARHGVVRVEYQVPRRVAAALKSVNLAIFDASGRRIRSLVDGRVPVGTHQAAWSGEDESGHPVAPGIYFLRLESVEVTEARRFVLVR